MNHQNKKKGTEEVKKKNEQGVSEKKFDHENPHHHP